VSELITKPSPRVISGLEPRADRQAGAKRALTLDSDVYAKSQACVHCGLCLPACPTYTQTGLEADSPRGRIMLMQGLADGKIDATDSVLKHLDLCLDCRGCETACPSGVVYHDLIEQSRHRLNQNRKVPIGQRLVDTMSFLVFPYPLRMKLGLLPARLLQRLGIWAWLNRSPLTKALPPQLAKMQEMLPDGGKLWETNLADFYKATRSVNAKTRIGFVSGCISSVLNQELNRQCIAMLQHAGCDVIVPKDQGCCGAIHHHGGKDEKAIQFARQNIDAFLPRNGQAVDYIVNNAAGCGAMLNEYDHLLGDDADYGERARQFVAKSRDISVLLMELDLPAPPHEVNRCVTYHDACHLAHAQKITDPPRQLLERIKGLKVKSLPESDICCGAAGTYNLTQPEMAGQLGKRKIENIQSTGADTCAVGNIGCSMQIDSQARQMGAKLDVVHPVSLLYEATFGPNASA
jgi:glycolate oxidase iron-sulfur subunit